MICLKIVLYLDSFDLSAQIQVAIPNNPTLSISKSQREIAKERPEQLRFVISSAAWSYRLPKL